MNRDQDERIEEVKKYGESAGAVTPDSQQRAQGEPVNAPEDEQDDATEPGAQGADADTMADGPDKESGFYG